MPFGSWVLGVAPIDPAPSRKQVVLCDWEGAVLTDVWAGVLSCQLHEDMPLYSNTYIMDLCFMIRVRYLLAGLLVHVYFRHFTFTLLGSSR